jgi:hypothetical protein
MKKSKHIKSDPKKAADNSRKILYGNFSQRKNQEIKKQQHCPLTRNGSKKTIDIYIGRYVLEM